MKSGRHTRHGQQRGHSGHAGRHSGATREREGHFWKDFFKRPHKTLYILAGIVVLVGAFRLVLPYLAEHYVNRQLQKSKTYAGTIGHIEMALWRGGYTIKNIKITKRNGKVQIPFFSAPAMDLSVDWDALVHHRIVAKIYMEQPKINFVKGPTAQQTQAGEGTSWNKMLENLVPFDINRLDIHNGEIRYRDPYSNPKVDIFFRELGATATNLSNALNQKQPLPAEIRANAKTIGNGEMFFHLRFNPTAPAPEYQLQASLTNVELPYLNDFFRAYGGFQVAHGTFAMFTSVAATNRAFEGYIKVFFKNMDVFSWKEEHDKSILNIFWDAIVGTATDVLKNHPKDQLATRIPIAGVYTNSQVDLVTTIGSLLRNGFVRALIPKFDRKVTTGEVATKVRRGQIPNATPNGAPARTNQAGVNTPPSPPSSEKSHGATLLTAPEQRTNMPAAPP